MRPPYWTALLRLFTLVALAFSAALFVDYRSSEVPYCSSSGCLAVRQHGRIGFLSLPTVGLIAFGTVYAVSLWGRIRRFRQLAQSLALSGAALGAALLGYQWLRVERFCGPCVVIDLAALLAGGAALGRILADRRNAVKLAKRQGIGQSIPEDPLADPRDLLLKPWAWVVLGVLVVVSPMLWPQVRKLPEVPPEIRALYVPGKINVVTFSDFECSHCRALHPILEEIMAEYPGQVHHVRVDTPLSSHAHARDAARMAICAEQQGQGPRVAKELYEAEELTDEANDFLARAVGLDLELLAHCVKDPSTEQRIEEGLALHEKAGLPVTPLTYVGLQRVPGADEQRIREAFASARGNPGNPGVPTWLYVSLVLAAFGATLRLGWAGRLG